LKIAVFETGEWEHDGCLRLRPRHEIVCLRDPLNDVTVASVPDAEIATTFIGSDLKGPLLRQLPKLRMIATRSTGYDHIDLAYCKARGITVCNVPDYGDHTVAEHAFALLLAISRHILDAVERARRGNFTQAGLRGFDLRGRTFGVIGAGRIGRRAIEIASGFGMQAIAYDPRQNAQIAEQFGFRYVSLDELLAASDVISLHLPARSETRHLLSDEAFAAMKPGAVLINTARGNIVDVAALVRALAEGKLRAAGLDVLPEEPLIREEAQIFRSNRPESEYDLRALVANHVLLRFPNVIVTPHIAYNTEEALGRILETTLANIEAFALGAPRNVVV
jgi:D-lactate dehydrogenase